MLIKQVQFRGTDEKGNIFCQPLLVDGLTKTAALDMRSKLHPTIQDFVRNLIPTPSGIYVLVNALGAGEYWGSNVNGDLFPEKALIHAPSDWEGLMVRDPDQARLVGQQWDYGFPTFMGAFPYKHHINKDPSRAFGRVELAVWNPKMHRVELVVYLDRALCKQFDAYDIIERIERGEFPDVSMGCRVPFDVCTICENRSKTRHDYCQHAATMMNKILPDGRKVAVRNDTPKFFDISFVFIGADKTAKVMAKLAQQENGQVCMGDFCTVPRSSAEVGEMFSKEASKARLRSALTGAGIGVGAGIAGNVAIKADKESRKKDVVKDGVAGALAGALSKIANDPIKKKVEVQGVPIHIEWKKGETRLYKKNGVVKYERLMKADYGYIPETKDSDGEEIDVYLGPDTSAPTAYVIKQMKKSGDFDENKVMVGYSSKAKARESYDHHMGGCKEFFGGISAVAVSSLRALFGENGDGKEKVKTAEEGCNCASSCCGSVDKLAALFPVSSEKSASHKKLSELIKSIPAGPFTKETLPRLEQTEQDIPQDVLGLMGGLPLSSSLSTPGMMGMVLKPREFQRLLLVRMGESPLADELDQNNVTFGQSRDVDESVPIGPEHVDDRLLELLVRLGFLRSRSAAAPSLNQRATDPNQVPASQGPAATSNDPLMQKIAAVYNGYRRSLVKKATVIQRYLTLEPQLSAGLFGASMAQAFAGGFDKVAASVFGPDSLAYLVGAYTDRDFHLSSDEAVASLALTGAVVRAA